ncbi:conserved hypothetical protein [uncultured Gammaproteobacteria bacterium]
MKRPPLQPVKGPRNETERQALAVRASYVGSTEHKEERWWGGLPGAPYSKNGIPTRPKKQKTTICPLVKEDDRDRATTWVQEAIVKGQYEFTEGDQDFPKHIWHEADEKYWFGFCTNPAAGQYKGWPVEKDEYNAYYS